jgi:ornithine cyclodeaminase/alanine dehydrogenase-like protein (mu-crystallin family)
MQPLLVSPPEIRGVVTMAEAVEAVRLGFREWGENALLNAPRRRIHIPTGVRVSVHQGGVPAANATGLMTHCEWVKPMASEQVYPRLNHPVIVLYDSAEGELKGIIVGEITCSELPDNIAVTGLRTAATSAVGTDLLARPDATTLGLFGAAGQAKNHLLALMQVRKLKKVKVFSRNPDNRKKFAEEMAPLTQLDIEPVASAEEAVHGVDIILTATNSSVPVFDGNWLQPGQHVTTIVGSNVGLVKNGFAAAKRREIDEKRRARYCLGRASGARRAGRHLRPGAARRHQVGSADRNRRHPRRQQRRQDQSRSNYFLQKQRRPRRRRRRPRRQGSRQHSEEKSRPATQLLNWSNEYFSPFAFLIFTFYFSHPSLSLPM